MDPVVVNNDEAISETALWVQIYHVQLVAQLNVQSEFLESTMFKEGAIPFLEKHSAYAHSR